MNMVHFLGRMVLTTKSPLIANTAQVTIIMNQNMQLKMFELERSNSTVGLYLGDTNLYFCSSY